MPGSSVASVPRDLRRWSKIRGVSASHSLGLRSSECAPRNKAFTFYLLEDQIIPGNPAAECLKMASTEANRISDLVAQLRGTYASRSKAIVAA